METAHEVIAALRAAAPPGLGQLDEAARQRLAVLTRSLLNLSPGADREYERFLAIAGRGLALPDEVLASWLAGATVLVTGGTGCVGSALMGQLTALGVRRLVSVSRGVTAGWPRPAGAEYLSADIRDLPALAGVLAAVRPDVVFHLAAQRDPGLAERAVHATVTTNVLGTRNLIEAAGRAGVARLVYASTGKALRPYSPDVYAASKRAAEWLVSAAAARTGSCYAAARFTHVVDNSLIHRRLLEWSAGGVVRLHAPDILFYAQSARESAQLLLCAGLGARRGSAPCYAITDLGWPVSLLDLALAVLRRTGSAAPLYISGYDAGYEDVPFPGLYDPLTAGGMSPLLSALEAARAEKAAGLAADVFPLTAAADPEVGKRLLALEEVCEVTAGPGAVRAALDALSWAQLEAALRAGPSGALARAAARAAAHPGRLSPCHTRLLAAMRRHSG